MRYGANVMSSIMQGIEVNATLRMPEVTARRKASMRPATRKLESSVNIAVVMGITRME